KRDENSSTVSPRCSASSWISRVETHTYPGAPVQQAPQRVHENSRPSRYHGDFRCDTLMKVPDLRASPVSRHGNGRPSHSSETRPRRQPPRIEAVAKPGFVRSARCPSHARSALSDRTVERWLSARKPAATPASADGRPDGVFGP